MLFRLMDSKFLELIKYLHVERHFNELKIFVYIRFISKTVTGIDYILFIFN